MASHLMSHAATVLVSVLLLCSAHQSVGARRLMELYKPQPSDLLTYHNGTVLQGDIPVSVIWYGRFTPAQKAGRRLRLPPVAHRRLASADPVRVAVVEHHQPALPVQGGEGQERRRCQDHHAGEARRPTVRRPVLAREKPHAVQAAGAGGEGQAQEGRDRGAAHRGGRGRGRVLHEPLRHARLKRQGAHGVRLGRQLRHAVPRPVRVARVAVPPAGLRASDAGAGAAQRRRRDGRHGDEHRQYGRRRRDQPVR
uniref:Uncharacterized protein n=1 Tax=Oryza brachyantha TaxID=4533 RepID=J3LH88_ORYBR